MRHALRLLSAAVHSGLAALLLAAAVHAEGDFRVSVVPSDDAALAEPAPRDGELTTAHVEAMVRRAVDLVGGMASVVPDTARMVLLKPNVGVERPRRSGVVTDDRVVRAVALLVYETAPNARIVIGEGPGGWASEEYRDSNPVEIWPGMYKDGFRTAGLRDVVAELRELGANIELVDLNFDAAYSLQVPEGGLATDEYSIAASIIDADVWINLPVAKTHGAQITCCMKNHFGILPGTLYGWSKSRGTDDHPAMPHTARVVDEAFVDLWSLTRVDLNIVDMITGSERGPFEETVRRQNIILAGRDPVATDLVAARLMGFNPDDLEFADLAAQRGMGPRWIDHVDILGAEVEPLVQRFHKAHVWYEQTEWAGKAAYGKGPRRWTLLGPLPRDHAFTDDEIATLSPTPGEDGWSQIVWFGHDKIDLDEYYEDPVRCAVYGYAEFTMPQADSVRYWMGADERLQVWIDGQPLYDTADDPDMGRRRRHRLGMVRRPGWLEAGDHRLLIRAEQNRGRFSFSFNVAEPVDDDRFAGNTYFGLRYHPAGTRDTLAARITSLGDVSFGNDDMGPLVGTFGDLPLMPHPDHSPTRRGDTLLVDFDARPAVGDDLLSAITAVTGRSTPWGSSNPFTMAAVGPGRLLDLVTSNAPSRELEMAQLMGVLGTRYELSAGFGPEESHEALREWLTAGHTPLIRDGEWVGIVTGHARTDSGYAVRLVDADTASYWHHFESDFSWWGDVPGAGRVRGPVLVVAAPESSEPEETARRAAAIAVESAMMPTTGTPVLWWDEPAPTPAGLDAWDWSVHRWERLPLTREWARQGLHWSLLARTRAQHLTPLIEDRRQAATLMRQLSSTTDGAAEPLGPAMVLAAGEYETVAAGLQKFHDLLPEDPRVPMPAAAAEVLEALRSHRGLLRSARDAERRALQTLSTALDRGPLPPSMADPLLHLEEGHLVYYTRTEWAEGIWEFALRGQSVSIEQLHGAQPEGVDIQERFESAVPDEAGWRLAVRIDEGGAAGWVFQQPTEENGWEARLRIDTLPAWWKPGPVAFSVWAVPEDVLTEGVRP